MIKQSRPRAVWPYGPEFMIRYRAALRRASVTLGDAR